MRGTGIGVAPDRLESIFRAFTQEEDSTTRRFGGTGLGLAICRTLSSLMGGELQVTSVKGEGRHVPIVALTAAEMMGGSERCLAAGMDAYLSKPFQPHSLLDQIARYLRDDIAPTVR